MIMPTASQSTVSPGRRGIPITYPTSPRPSARDFFFLPSRQGVKRVTFAHPAANGIAHLRLRCFCMPCVYREPHPIAGIAKETPKLMSFCNANITSPAKWVWIFVGAEHVFFEAP